MGHAGLFFDSTARRVAKSITMRRNVLKDRKHAIYFWAVFGPISIKKSRGIVWERIISFLVKEVINAGKTTAE